MRHWKIFLTTLLLPLSCSRNPNLYEAAESASKDFNEGPPQGLSLVPYYASVNQSFTAQAAPPVDILISVDNEEDIRGNLDLFIQNIPRWVAMLKNRPIDFQVGVVRSTTIGGSAITYDTTLQGPNRVVSSVLADADSRISADLAAIRNSSVGSNPRVFRNIYEAYQDPRNAVLFRANALPVFLAFSDDEDIDYSGSQKTADYYVSYFLNYFKQFTPLHSWMLSAFGSPTANPCLEDDVSDERFIEPLTAAAGGAFLRFCDSDYGLLADAFARSVFSLTTAVNLGNSIPAGLRVDSSSVVVKVNGNAINPDSGSGYVWNGFNNAISFPGVYVPAAGSLVEVALEYLVP